MSIRTWASQHQKGAHQCVGVAQTAMHTGPRTLLALQACEPVAALDGSIVSACCPIWHVVHHTACRSYTVGVVRTVSSSTDTAMVMSHTGKN